MARGGKRRKLKEQKFVHHVMTYVRDEFPAASGGFSDEELDVLIRDGADSAISFGFETERDIVGFIDLQWRLSPTFYTDGETAWAAEILNDSDMNAEMKLAALRNAWAIHESLRNEE